MDPETENKNVHTENGQESTPSTPQETPEPEQKAEGSDSNKTYAILGYILPFLFFLPLMNADTKDDPTVRFHANQQLSLFVTIVAGYVLASILYEILSLYILKDVVLLGWLVFAILGIINVSKGEKKELPFIGQFKLLS